jgi:hypothetical protein
MMSVWPCGGFQFAGQEAANQGESQLRQDECGYHDEVREEKDVQVWLVPDGF